MGSYVGLKKRPREFPVSITNNLHREFEQAILQCKDICLKIVEANSDIGSFQIDNPNDLQRIASALSQISRAAIDMEKWECEKTRQLEDAGEAIKIEIRRMLQERPQLATQLCEIADSATKRVQAAVFVPSGNGNGLIKPR